MDFMRKRLYWCLPSWIRGSHVELSWVYRCADCGFNATPPTAK